jgi:hypothetical protein
MSTDILVDVSNVANVQIKDGRILLVIDMYPGTDWSTVDEFDTSYEFAETDLVGLKSFFPLLVYRNGKYLLSTNDGTKYFAFDQPELESSGVDGRYMDMLRDMTDSDGSTKVVKEAGFEKEYCLLFGNRIFFHSPSEEEMLAFKEKNQHLLFIAYYPSTN